MVLTNRSYSCNHFHLLASLHRKHIIKQTSFECFLLQCKHETTKSFLSQTFASTGIDCWSNIAHNHILVSIVHLLLCVYVAISWERTQQFWLSSQKPEGVNSNCEPYSANNDNAQSWPALMFPDTQLKRHKLRETRDGHRPCIITFHILNVDFAQ